MIVRSKSYRRQSKHPEIVNAPDVKGPRFKYKTTGSLNRPIIMRFKRKYPQYAHYDNVVLRSIIILQCKKICYTVATTRDGVELPAALGHIFLGSILKNPKSELINYHESVKLGRKVLHRNLHTDNHIATIVYSNFDTRYQLANRRLWRFSGVRSFTRMVSKEFSKNWRMFAVRNHDIIQGNNEKIHNAIGNRRRAKNDKKFLEYAMDDYNEFDID